jgi:hypothetical protein
MAKAVKSKQLSITLPDKVGLLAEITGALAGAKVNIEALCAYGMEDTGTFLLLTDSNAKAKKALSVFKDGKVEEEDVIVVEMANKPGELGKVADKVTGAGVNIWYLYCNAATKTKSVCILKTEDDKKAIKVINA